MFTIKVIRQLNEAPTVKLFNNKGKEILVEEAEFLENTISLEIRIKGYNVTKERKKKVKENEEAKEDDGRIWKF